jgi:hypothetical protein
MVTMQNTIILFILFTLSACGIRGKDGKNGSSYPDGATSLGIKGTTTSIDFEDINPGLACQNGGVSIFTFQDSNSDGVFQSDETILKIKAICNGNDGANGTDGSSASLTLESVTSSSTCPNGGIKISSANLNPVEVCNGVNGINGEQGLPGIQGIPGLAGADGVDGINGTEITPVKFCTDDNSTYPEYGLLIDGELFAVYWGPTSVSPRSPQAFLTKLVSGHYMSTGGNNCLFTVM